VVDIGIIIIIIVIVIMNHHHHGRSSSSQGIVKAPNHPDASDVVVQAIDRTHRIGQTRNVKAVRYIVKDTIEERILEVPLPILAYSQALPLITLSRLWEEGSNNPMTPFCPSDG